MWLGVDYYPEQWDISMIDKDLDNIIELGSNVIRIGEFAWHIMEKEEGKYDFSFFDMVIKKASEKGLKVIFGILFHNIYRNTHRFLHVQTHYQVAKPLYFFHLYSVLQEFVQFF